MSLLVLYAGDFGEAVAARLRAVEPKACARSLLAPAAELEEAVARADFVAVATWRPYVEPSRWLDDACHRHGRHWSLVEVAGTTLGCGPLVVPGAGAGCYHCYVARIDAHKREGDRRRVLRQAYAADPQLGPRGYTPAMVAIAAAALLQDRADGTPGRFRHVDVLSGSVMDSELIPLHDCGRCRPSPADYQPQRRYVEVMKGELEMLLP